MLEKINIKIPSYINLLTSVRPFCYYLESLHVTLRHLSNNFHIWKFDLTCPIKEEIKIIFHLLFATKGLTL